MEVSAELYQGGRITIPKIIRQQFHMEGGDQVTFRIENNKLTILTEKQLLEEARAALRADVPADYSLVDEFIAERRAEAAKENLEDFEYLKNVTQKDDQKA